MVSDLQTKCNMRQREAK
uniref:Uncharacterized protein n=1 Tax=Anguilla anguilla TaxID=7936 RepID=A0A0E9XSC5_ANGAN